MQYAINCLDKSALATIYAFRLAKQYFPFDIIDLQTDNGSEFRGRFAEYLLNHVLIIVLFRSAVRPGMAKWNEPTAAWMMSII